MLFSFTLTACGAEEEQQTNQAREYTTIILKIGSPTMTVNDTAMSIDDQGTVPVIINSRTLLPVRAVVEQMGGTVDWNSETREVTLIYGSDEIVLKIDSETARLNGESVTLDVSPRIMNSRTMLPIRFISESFKFDILWNGDEQTVTITNTNTNTNTEAIEENPVTTPEEVMQPTGKSLVVYFSATGNTKSLAEKIATETNSDIFEIVPEEPYSREDLNYNDNDCRANREQENDEARPEISSRLENIENYDTIIIGYPIWWGTMPKIINTFLETYDLSGKTIMPFCTSGGSGITSSVNAIRNTCTDSTVTEGLRGSSGTTATQIQTWLNDNNFSETAATRIRLTANNQEIIIILDDNPAADDLVSMLPCTLDFSDFNNTEKIAYPERELNIAGVTSGTTPNAGDLTIYRPWGNLALFYRDFSYSSDLIHIGEIEKGMENISALDGEVQVEILK